MTRRDIGEANIVQQGLDTLAADAGAAAGDVPTLGEDGAVAFATPEGGSGGSQPENVRRLDLGVVALADLFEDVTLYTPDAGELVGPVYLNDIVYLDGNIIDRAIQVFGPEFDMASTPQVPQLAVIDTDLARDSIGAVTDSDPAVSPLTAGVVKARAAIDAGSDLSDASAIWEAARAYDGFYQIVGSDGHGWEADDGGGTSGGSEPAFAANHGGTVTDNDIVWTDKGAIVIGSFHVYADVCNPATP